MVHRETAGAQRLKWSCWNHSRPYNFERQYETREKVYLLTPVLDEMSLSSILGYFVPKTNKITPAS